VSFIYHLVLCFVSYKGKVMMDVFCCGFQNALYF
jgi:hypothetical protein